MARQNFYALGTSIAGIEDSLESGVRTGLAIAEARNRSDRQKKSDEDAAEEKTYRRGRESKQDTLEDEKRGLAAIDRETRLRREGFAEDEAIAAKKKAGIEERAGELDLDERNRSEFDRLGKERDAIREEQRRGLEEYEANKKNAAGNLKAIAEKRLDPRTMSHTDFFNTAVYASNLDPAFLHSDGKTPSLARQSFQGALQAYQGGDLEKAGMFASQFYQGDVLRNIDGEGPEPDTVITGKEPAGFVPSPDDPDSLALALKVRGRHPKNGDFEYLALATKKGTAGDDDAPLNIKQTEVFQRIEDVQQLESMINDDPELKDKFDRGMAEGADRFRTLRELAARAGVKVPTEKELAKEAREAKKGDVEIKNIESQIKDREAAAVDRRTRSNRVAAGRGAGGKGSADMQMLDRLSGTLFANEKDPAKRERLALDELSKIKKLAQKSSGPADFKARFLAGAAQRIFDKESGKEMSDIADELANSIYGGGGGGVGNFEEGKVYEDASGNRAVYQGGQFVPADDFAPVEE